MEGAIEVVRTGLGAALAVSGLVFIAGGMLGFLRFPDFYTRLHAVRVSDSAGAVLVCLGLAILARDGAVTLRIVLLAVLIGGLGPLMAQLVANAAHAGGLAPLSGRFTAPRPNSKRTVSE